MPIVSKYSQDQQEKLFQSLLAQLTQDQIPRDLALMTLGNLVTHVLNQEPSANRREQLAKQFGAILIQSVQEK
ncbi:DUF1414 domain-containing protein [Aliidiomarina celeris]|uniref:DUF1414 domain-containing protein n=1 Tax=Aliidiomarina celeris TaxID=2249428 RepID=UPI000DE9D5F8|nr:DUF1414 domain-containing protein [Aliidiomarina celeris]